MRDKGKDAKVEAPVVADIDRRSAGFVRRNRVPNIVRTHHTISLACALSPGLEGEVIYKQLVYWDAIAMLFDTPPHLLWLNCISTHCANLTIAFVSTYWNSVGLFFWSVTEPTTPVPPRGATMGSNVQRPASPPPAAHLTISGHISRTSAFVGCWELVHLGCKSGQPSYRLGGPTAGSTQPIYCSP